MCDKSINYFLVESNRLKMGGYEKVSRQFLKDLVSFIYEENPTAGKRVLSRLLKGDLSNYYINDLVKSFIRKEGYLATYENNKKLRSIYIKAQLVDSYKEFAFILYLLGVVNPFDYLRYNKDIDFIVSKFRVERRVCLSSDVIKRIEISYSRYAEIMCGFLKNATDGIDYGFCIYDFLYHALSAVGDKRGNYNAFNKYADLIKLLGKLNISSRSPLYSDLDVGEESLNQGIVDKYLEEIGVLLPMISGELVRVFGKEKVDKLVFYVLNNAPIMLVETLLTNRDFIQKMGMKGVKYKG